MHDGEVAATDVVLDAGILILIAVIGDAPPGSNHHGPVVAVQADVRHHAVPTARDGIGAAVRLVVDADAEHAPVPAAQRPAVAEDQHHFGFVVGFAEGA